jgi:hypothetical protein
MQNYVTLGELASEFGMEKTNIRKYALAKGFTFTKLRDKRSNNQIVIALTLEETNELRNTREREGFTNQDKPIDNGNGYFYIIQLIPELDESRIKLGFASNVQNRLNSHRTAAPTAKLLKSWPCKKTWEIAAIASLTRCNCKSIGSEVYSFENIENLILEGNRFFELMPSVYL